MTWCIPMKVISLCEWFYKDKSFGIDKCLLLYSDEIQFTKGFNQICGDNK